MDKWHELKKWLLARHRDVDTDSERLALRATLFEMQRIEDERKDLARQEHASQIAVDSAVRRFVS